MRQASRRPSPGFAGGATIRATSAEKVARKIVEKVREDGDEAVFAFTRKFDKADLDSFEVKRDEWDEGCEAMDPADRAALGKAAMRVREFHRKRIPSSWEMREEGGAYMGQRVRPLRRVGVYVPGGKAVYPSTVIMNAVPASVVEVPEIVMVTPPEPDGSISPEVLMAARVAGVHRIFKMGGAQAVAALAYGTESVPRVDKIVGPGNAYVQAAKRLRVRRGRHRQRGRRHRGAGGGRPHGDARLGRGRPDLPGRARGGRRGDPRDPREVASRRACRSRSRSS